MRHSVHPAKTAAELEAELKEAHEYIGRLWIAVMMQGESVVAAVQDDIIRQKAKQAAERARNR